MHQYIGCIRYACFGHQDSIQNILIFYTPVTENQHLFLQRQTALYNKMTKTVSPEKKKKHRHETLFYLFKLNITFNDKMETLDVSNIRKDFKN